MKHTPSVWIVEDDALYRDTVKQMLHADPDIGEVLVFDNCEDAIAIVENGEAASIILMDIGLPGMNGIEGIRHIKARSPNTYIVMLTIHEDNDKIFAALCNGASGYLLKPASRDQLQEAIRIAQRGGAPINPHIAGKVLQMFQHLAIPKHDYGLTDREHQVLNLMAQDLKKPDIAERLDVTYHTIDMHVRNIYAKLHVHTATGAIAKAARAGLI